MSGLDPDLQQYLGVIRELLADHAVSGHDVDSDEAVTALEEALGEIDVQSLADETAEMSTSLLWLTSAVSEIATVTPSLAFAVAAHFTARRAVASVDGASDAEARGTGGVIDESRAVVPAAFEPDVAVLLDSVKGSAALVPSAGLTHTLEDGSFSGLRGARLRDVRVVDTQPARELDPPAAARAICDWSVLCAAVSLGIAQSSLRTAEVYAAERRQFGSALSSFTAVRARLAEMRLKLETVHALLERAVQPEGSDLDCWLVAADAGRVAVILALDAIQVLGGYGYIEEYAAARQLRDAVSVNARSGARRAALAHIARSRLGLAEWEASL